MSRNSLLETGAKSEVESRCSQLLLLLSLSSLLTLSLPAADKTQYFVHLGFSSTLQLINGISSDLQKLLKYFNYTAIVTFFRSPSASFGAG